MVKDIPLNIKNNREETVIDELDLVHDQSNNKKEPLKLINNEKGSNYKNKVVLAPMVRTGTLPMRLTALDYGADLVYSPEIVDKRIIGSERTWNERTQTFDYVKNGKINFRTVPREKKHLIFQLGTADPDLALEAARTVLPDISGVDVNCGCPKRFSIQGGMGAALLTDPDRLEKILRNLVNNLNIPVTCKIRILSTKEETLALCRRLEKTGVHAIAVHCRTRDERPAQKAHWDALKYIADEIKSIPIIANGDVFRPEDIEKVKKETGVSSVMIARGAIKNPSIFCKDGLIDLKVVVKNYVKHAIETDFLYQNIKYVLTQMYDDPKSDEFRLFQKAKSLREIASALDQEEYFLKFQNTFKSREAEGSNDLGSKALDCSDSNSIKRPLDDESNLETDTKKSRACEVIE